MLINRRLTRDVNNGGMMKRREIQTRTDATRQQIDKLRSLYLTDSRGRVAVVKFASSFYAAVDATIIAQATPKNASLVHFLILWCFKTKYRG